MDSPPEFRIMMGVLYQEGKREKQKNKMQEENREQRKENRE
jgi:hypothetical protein